jgi:hypothetical protein
MDTSELTSKQPISKQEKEGTPTLKKRGENKTKNKTEDCFEQQRN